ncbi:putative cytochrome B561 [Neisseria meningitidis]|nr:hypothetical protein [Neisseria meningitidis]CKK97976.1 putative cytochrome B561 [Neisseria meningitidis]
MNTNQPAVYDPLTRTLHWLTVAGFIGIPTTIVLWAKIIACFDTDTLI